MAICFKTTLTEALEKIQHHSSHTFPIHNRHKVRDVFSSCDIIDKYGQQKWAVVELLNKTYGAKFDLYNWITQIVTEEVAYFLNEAGSNSLNYTEYKAPDNFSLWLGKKGFIISIEQQGTGFDAQRIHQLEIKENEGAGFDFFRNCKGKVFFDDHENAKIIYLQLLLNR